MKSKKKMVIIGSIIVVFAVMVIIFKVSALGKGGGNAVEAVESKVYVKTALATYTEKEASLSYKATLDSKEEGIVSSKVSGKVIKILFDNGTEVNAGDPLIVLDDKDLRNQLKTAQNQLNTLQIQLKNANTQYDSALNQIDSYENQLKSSQNQLNVSGPNLDKAQVSLDNAQKNYDRYKTLFDSGVITQVDLDNASNTLKVAQADFKTAQANMNSLNINIDTAKINLKNAQVSVESAKNGIEVAKANIEAQKISIDTINDSIANTIIKAPITGKVSNKNVELGQIIAAGGGSILAKVEVVNTLNALVDVSQEDAVSVKIGQKASVYTDTKKSAQSEGVVETVDAAADPTSRVVKCEIQISNDNNTLKPGMSCKVQIFSGEKHEVITIPQKALLEDEGTYSVFVLKNGKAVKQSVTIGEVSNDSVEITKGVKSKDKIIITNLSTLQNGDSVKETAE